ncbi:TVP38/TMEM64 family membrane protein [Baekduia alba]|uniref:TVP38/TMEM64 family protein n=1 Tax=Baekduia alba TaxID=2997333 RepID=UPI00233FFF0D|nr:TVP38/TMEM64 family protein [Baekduia alba]WCB91970.1 TVP38/TMEM64 family membrane protein [Baekduia alba]
MRALARLAYLGVLIVGAFVLVASTGKLSSDRIRDWMDGYGVLGPLIFIAVSACLTPALFPGPLLAGAAGLLFGTWLGTPIAIVSATLGAMLAFSLSRWIAHDAVVELQGPRLRALREWIGRRGFLSVLYARIVPGVPYSLVNYAAGLSPVALRTFAAATALGCAPRAFAYTALGGSLDDLGSPEAFAAFAVLIIMALVGALAARRDLRSARAPAPGTATSSPAARSAGRP